MEKTDCRELLEVHRNVIDVESIAFLMILLAPEVSFVTLHMRWHKACFPKASTKIYMYAHALIGQSAVGYCAGKPTENRMSSELLYKSNRPQVSMGYRLINRLGCGWWFTNSSRVLPTSRVVYQPITHRNLWSIASI